MKLAIAIGLIGSVLLSGCIKEVQDLTQDMQAQPRKYPNDSASRMLNEMKRPPGVMTAAGADARDARIAALEQELAKLRAELSRAPSTPQEVTKVEKKTIIELRAQELFASGSAELTPEGAKALKRTADTLRPFAAVVKNVRVDGHTDNQPIQTRRFPSNQELSEARARTVAEYLQQMTGLPWDRFAMTGYADSRPVASNGDAAGRARNRRVEVTIHSSEAASPEPPPVNARP